MRYALEGSVRKANVQARQMFEKSIDLDPKYTLAHSLLAETHLMVWSFGWSQDARWVDRAFEPAQTTIALDDSPSEAHCLLDNVYLWKKWHEQAISLVRNDADRFVGYRIRQVVSIFLLAVL